MSINQCPQTWGLFLHDTFYSSLSGCYKLLYIHSPRTRTVQTNQNEAAQSSIFISPSFSGLPFGSLSCNFSIHYSAHYLHSLSSFLSTSLFFSSPVLPLLPASISLLQLLFSHITIWLYQPHSSELHFCSLQSHLIPVL